MTELEYVIAHFESRFAPFKGKRIVLHGSREYAKAIIDHFDSDFHFAGIMSRDPIEGEVFHGLPVLDDANMPLADIDMILLTERVKYAEAVYQDLHNECEHAGILLYDMYGLDEIATHREIMRQQKYAAEWVEYARGFDIVVFETMDTLLAEGVFVGDRSIQPTLQALVDDLMELKRSRKTAHPAARGGPFLPNAPGRKPGKADPVYRNGTRQRMYPPSVLRDRDLPFSAI